MKKLFITALMLPISVASIAFYGVNAQNTVAENSTLTEKEQAKLDKELEGRVAGPARSCIQLRDQKNYRAISDDVLIFSSSRNAKTIYVNRPQNGCRGAKRDTLTYQRPDTALCHGNIASVVDFQANITVSSCALGKFIPYTKTDK